MCVCVCVCVRVSAWKKAVNNAQVQLEHQHNRLPCRAVPSLPFPARVVIVCLLPIFVFVGPSVCLCVGV